MSAVQKIEAAIRALSAKDKEQLVADMPRILPQLSSESELKEVVATAGTHAREQTPEEEKIIHRIVTDYRAEQRR